MFNSNAISRHATVSSTEPKEIARYRLKSLSDCLEVPSAILIQTESELL